MTKMWILVIILGNGSGSDMEMDFHRFHFEESCQETVETLERLNQPGFIEAFCIEDGETA